MTLDSWCKLLPFLSLFIQHVIVDIILLSLHIFVKRLRQVWGLVPWGVPSTHPWGLSFITLFYYDFILIQMSCASFFQECDDIDTYYCAACCGRSTLCFLVGLWDSFVALQDLFLKFILNPLFVLIISWRLFPLMPANDSTLKRVYKEGSVEDCFFRSFSFFLQLHQDVSLSSSSLLPFVVLMFMSRSAFKKVVKCALATCEKVGVRPFWEKWIEVLFLVSRKMSVR